MTRILFGRIRSSPLLLKGGFGASSLFSGVIRTLPFRVLGQDSVIVHRVRREFWLHLYCITVISSFSRCLLLSAFMYRCCLIVGYVRYLVSFMTALNFRHSILMTVFGGRQYYSVTSFSLQFLTLVKSGASSLSVKN